MVSIVVLCISSLNLSPDPSLHSRAVKTKGKKNHIFHDHSLPYPSHTFFLLFPSPSPPHENLVWNQIMRHCNTKTSERKWRCITAGQSITSQKKWKHCIMANTMVMTCQTRWMKTLRPATTRAATCTPNITFGHPTGYFGKSEASFISIVLDLFSLIYIICHISCIPANARHVFKDYALGKNTYGHYLVEKINKTPK